MSTVLVTDARRGAAVAVIRSLAAAGHRVVAADSGRVSAGRWSRCSDVSVLHPDPLIDGEGAAEAIARHVREHDVDLVVPVTEPVIAALRTAPDWPASCRIAVEDDERLDVVRHKERTLELAATLGVPVPTSVRVATLAEARAAVGSIGWPIVLKPEASVAVDDDGRIHKFEVAYARDDAQLERAMTRFEGLTPVLLQEFCVGVGVGVEVLAHKGELLAAFAHRRVREVPITGGASSFRVSVELDPDLLQHAAELMRAIGWTGLAMVEFKVGPRGPRLMEINGRLWGSLPLAAKAGMDFPARLVALLLDGPPAGRALDTDYRVGVRSRNLELELVWIAGVLRGPKATNPGTEFPARRDALRVAARLPLPADGYDILSWRDPGAGAAELLHLAGKPLRKVRRG